MACSTWVREKDEIILEILKRAEEMPTVEELTQMTGLRRFQIEHTLKMWRMQARMAAARKRLLD